MRTFVVIVITVAVAIALAAVLSSCAPKQTRTPAPSLAQAKQSAAQASRYVYDGKTMIDRAMKLGERIDAKLLLLEE